jgi:hypothetical protein
MLMLVLMLAKIFGRAPWASDALPPGRRKRLGYEHVDSRGVAERLRWRRASPHLHSPWSDPRSGKND